MTAELALFRFDNGLRRRAEDAEEQVHLTPEYVLDPVRAVLGGRIELDPCTTADNPVGAERFYALPDDGAARSWSAATVFCNPPYGEARVRWVRRCAEAGAAGSRVVLLIPAHTDTRIWHEAMASATSLLFVKGRVKFGVPRTNGRQVAASHPSALIGWNVDLRHADELGSAFLLRTQPPAAYVDIPLGQ
ncbi:DNA N-6-adenine-methyltransferase (plasmid) [Rhodococcus sp. D-6]|uniref:DNA N-6-adenine-methyltransferase n=1 Tax=Rhodococcus sp. D-6 TaxID=1387842 RepID=A0AAU7V3Z9_9NOCA